MELNDKNIRLAVPGDVLRDPKIPGLHMRVFPRCRTYYYRYRTHGGSERRPKLGAHPLISLTQARELANKLLVKVAAGRDPGAERETSRSAPTMAALCEQYMREYAPKKKSGKRDEEMINAVIIKKLGSHKVSAIQEDDIGELHKAMAKTPIQANRVLALLSKMFSLAEKWKYRVQHSSPTRFIDRYPEKARRRIMSTAEAVAIAAGLRKYEPFQPEAAAFIYMLILSGARSGEVAAARWEWLDGAVLNLQDSKTGAKSVYLPTQVMALLEPYRKETGLILGIKSPRALWQKVRTEAGCPDLRLHDLRRTFASAALTAGYSLAQVGELLGHASPQTTAGYAYLMPQPAAKAVDVIAGKLTEMMAPAE